MATSKPNGVSVVRERTICERCAQPRPPFNDEGVCAVCEASWNGYEEGRQFSTLLHLGYAIESALDHGNVTPAQVRAAVDVALAGETHPDTTQEITELGSTDAATREPTSADMIDVMTRAALIDVEELYAKINRTGGGRERQLLERKLRHTLEALGSGGWLTRDEEA